MKLDYSDSDLVSAINNMLSCLLPHPNFNKRFFGEVLNSLVTLIKPNEMNVPLNIIIELLTELNKINIISPDYRPKLTRSSLEELISSGLQEYIQTHMYLVKNYLEINGLDTNLENPLVYDNCINSIVNSTMDLYDDAFSLERSSEDFNTIFLTLKKCVKANAISNAVATQARIIESYVREYNKIYRGFDGALEFMKAFTNDIESRINNIENSVFVVDSLDKIEYLRQQNSENTKPLCNYGIPMLDDYTPMLSKRLVILVANPNVGKTVMVSENIAKSLVAGKKVALYPGETDASVFHNAIISAYIRLKFNSFVSTFKVSGVEECDEEANRLINIANVEIAESGRLIYIENLTYDNCYSELEELYKQHKFDMLFIDHSASLNDAPGSRLFSRKDRIDKEMVELRKFKKKYPVYIMVTSHPSVTASEQIIKFGYVKTDETCRDSSAPNKEADEVFILFTNELLEPQNKYLLQVKKRRQSPPINNLIVLKRIPKFSWFEYRPEYQFESSDDITAENAVEEIKKVQEEDWEDSEGISFAETIDFI